LSDFGDESHQFARLFTEPAPVHERAPLDSTGGIIAVRLRKSNRFGFNSGCSVTEGRGDRLHQTLSLKRIHAGEEGEIVEVFHSAVEETERRQRFQLLGNDRLFRIGAEHRRREIQQAWLFYVRGFRSNDIAEADIELHRNSRSRERCVELDSDTLVIRVFFDPADLD